MNQLSSKTQEILKNRQGKRVVFTNGCFDILHRGHVSYLQSAREQGDFLIVGLNSDHSVRGLGKGADRPIVCQDDRKFVLEALRAVDSVEIFDEPTPLNLISQILPDLLVKGGDWSVDQIVGSDVVMKNGGEVKSLQFIEGNSSTDIITKIRNTLP